MDPKNQKKNYLNNYAKYSGIAFQMLFIILLGVWGGYKIDQWVEWQFPVFIIIFSIISVFGAIYVVTKDLLKKK
jgi:F0F1-type ATP synthase assembly protein I